MRRASRLTRFSLPFPEGKGVAGVRVWGRGVFASFFRNNLTQNFDGPTSPPKKEIRVDPKGARESEARRKLREDGTGVEVGGRRFHPTKPRYLQRRRSLYNTPFSKAGLAGT